MLAERQAYLLKQNDASKGSSECLRTKIAGALEALVEGKESGQVRAHLRPKSPSNDGCCNRTITTLPWFAFSYSASHQNPREMQLCRDTFRKQALCGQFFVFRGLLRYMEGSSLQRQVHEWQHQNVQVFLASIQ
jgi:hypothetical protein